ncbi:MAG: hypothetical protein CL868_15540 [Cytophagaceae bacterium]|nr:hypothetical protein [Cytophagaceae bacterium]
MRLLLFPLAILLGIFSFSTLESPSPETATIKGAWELVDFYYYEDNEVMDTVIPTKGYRQVKVFTKDRVMWTRSAPIDSVEWFGYGRYIVADDKLIETLEYGSASMMKIIDTMRMFTFELQITEDSYRQITLDENGDRFSSENYKRIDK